ncbi:hypothetical protein RYX36_032237 [Vicia faba]
MDSHGSHHQSYNGGERRVNVVRSGKGYGSRGIWSPNSSQQNEKSWSFNNPEAKRKKRIAKYKVHSVKGKVKATLQNGLRWIKKKCSQISHGYK